MKTYNVKTVSTCYATSQVEANSKKEAIENYHEGCITNIEEENKGIEIESIEEVKDN